MDGVDTLDDEVESELDDTLKQQKIVVNSTEYAAVQYFLQDGSNFVSVDEILWCDHSHETDLAVPSCSRNIVYSLIISK